MKQKIQSENITFCVGAECKKKKYCYRCLCHWEIPEGKEIARLDEGAAKHCTEHQYFMYLPLGDGSR